MTADLEQIRPLTAEETPNDWRMSAYYYSFTKTGIAAIDRILSAVACAGKGFHHTEGWTENTEPYKHLRGNCYADMIENAAHDAAEQIRKRESAIDALSAPVTREELVETIRRIFFAPGHVPTADLPNVLADAILERIRGGQVISPPAVGRDEVIEELQRRVKLLEAGVCPEAARQMARINRPSPSDNNGEKP